MSETIPQNELPLCCVVFPLNARHSLQGIHLELHSRLPPSGSRSGQFSALAKGFGGMGSCDAHIAFDRIHATVEGEIA